MDQDRTDEQPTRAFGSLPPEGDETLAQAPASPRAHSRALPAAIGDYRIVGVSARAAWASSTRPSSPRRGGASRSRSCAASSWSTSCA